MDAVPSKLQTHLPRSIRRRRKNGGYDAWDSAKTSFGLSFTSAFCLIVGWLSYPLGLVLLIFGGLLSPVALSFLIKILIKIRKHKYLVKYGHAVVGEVTSSEAHAFPEFGSYHTVVYKFFTDEGLAIESKWEHADQPFWNCKHEDKFIVIYQPGHPSHHIAYESALYEVE